MSGIGVTVERERVVKASAERVWAWVCDGRELGVFQVNVFHARAESDGGPLAVGSRVRIEHRLGLARELREARVTALAPWEIAWSETRVGGSDWFPHAQRLVLVPLGPGACRLTNTLRGTFRLPGAGWWLVPWYRHVLPAVLDLENRRIARAVEAPGQPSGASTLT